MCVVRIYAIFGNITDYLLFILHLYAHIGSGICDKRNCSIFQRSDANYQHILTGWNLVDTNHVGCKYVEKLPMVN